MSDCCLPNLGCLSIPVLSTNVAGNTGAPGAAATIAIGTVTTVNPGDPATVTNVGTSGAAIFDFEIPEGVAGTGTPGVNGVARLYSNLGTRTSLFVGSWRVVDTYSLAAGELSNNGDSIVVNLLSSTKLTGTGLANAVNMRRIMFNSQSCSTMIIPNNEPYMFVYPNVIPPVVPTDIDKKLFNLKVEIIRISSSGCICNCYAEIFNQQTYTDLPFNYTYQTTITGINFNQINTITTELNQFALDGVYFNSVTIDKIKAI